MEDLQNQISALRNDILRLDGAIESIPQKIVAVLSTYEVNYGSSTLTANYINNVSSESLEFNFMHKDIIEEDSTFVFPEDQIPPEWQVGRLTAQLTYAYERIAALENQLLSRHLANK